MKALETLFERLLYASRFLMVVPVVAALLAAVAVLFVATVDTLVLVGRVAGFPALDTAAQATARIELISGIVGALDSYLIAAVLLLFALGLYELFVNKIDALENSEFASRLLLIKSLDDLKDRLASVILVILVVKFFQIALALKYTNAADLLMLAVGIALVSVALWLAGRKGGKAAGEDKAA